MNCFARLFSRALTITALLLSISTLTGVICRALEPQDIEGLYTDGPHFAGFVSLSIELKDKRFKFSIFNDASGAEEDIATYRLDGIRVFLVGDKPEFAEVRIWTSYDGVAMLLTTDQYRELKTKSKISNFVLVRATPKELEDSGWWRKLRKEHPKFAAAIGQPLDE